MSKIYFTSDTHFGSSRTLNLSRRPFSTVDDMDKAMLDNYNSKVTDDDIVYHLGDFGDYKFAKSMNGHKSLIWGNYELNEFISRYNILEILESSDDMYYHNYLKKKLVNHPNTRNETIWRYLKTRVLNSTTPKLYSIIIQNISEFNEELRQYGFDDIIDFSGTVIAHDNVQLILIHEPVMCVKNIDLTDFMNLFGHIHGRQLIKRYGIDVGVDGHHFYPISIDDVMFYRNAIMKHYDINVFI